MQLYERPNSRYLWATFTINGKTYRFSTKRPKHDKAGARRFMAAEYNRLMNAAQFGQKPETTLAEAFNRVIARVADNESTHTSYLLAKRQTLGLDKFALKDWFSLPADLPLSKLHDGHLEDLVAARKAAGHSGNTINAVLRVIKAAVNASKKRFACNQDLTFPMQRHFEKTRFLTYEEEAAILADLDQHQGNPAYDKARDLFVFLIDTGVRLSEALNMSWANINLSQGAMEVYRIKTNSLSMVPISDRVRELLERKRDCQAPFESMDRAVKHLRSAIAKVCNGNPKVNAQRGKATIHSLRDTYASRLASKGLSLHKVSKLLGHTSVTMTRKYAHIEPQDVASEARQLLNA